MRPAISIDFGAAFTKVAFRPEPESTSSLLQHEKLRLDEGHFCIPTIAAWRESDDRWIFGADAVDLKSGEGIHVFRNWKPLLFNPPEESLDPESSIGRLFYYSLDQVGGQARQPLETIAVRYFEWLLEVMLPGLMGYEECEDPILRVSIPDFNGESEFGELMETILAEAGWGTPSITTVPEPLSNLTGALSQGKNQIVLDGRNMMPDLAAIFSGSGLIDYIELTAKEDGLDPFTLLLIDVGAYTTDFALVSIDASSRGSLPPCEAHSVPFGIEFLDNLVKHGVSPEKSEIIAQLSATDREAFRRTVYTEERSWALGDVTIGTDDDEAIVEKCINGLSTRIGNEIERFVERFAIDQINEVVLTGGGTNIPRITRKLADRLAGLGVETVHSSSSVMVVTSGIQNVKLNQEVVRGSSALGGASILFGDS